MTQQPASGTITVSGNQLLYTPAQGDPTKVSSTWLTHVTTTGTQTATIQVCETAPSALCATATMTYSPATTGFYVGNQLERPRALRSRWSNDTGAGIVVPANAASGSTFTSVTAPSEANLPSTNSASP